jgi:hypothetical protein
VIQVSHNGADIVEHSVKDLLEIFGPSLKISGVGDVKDAMPLGPRQAIDQVGVCLFDGGERRSGGAPGARLMIDERSPRAIDHLSGVGLGRATYPRRLAWPLRNVFWAIDWGATSGEGSRGASTFVIAAFSLCEQLISYYEPLTIFDVNSKL